MDAKTDESPGAVAGQVDRGVRLPAETWMGFVRPGDLLVPKPLFNRSEGNRLRRLPTPCRVEYVQRNVWGCQSGVTYTVRTIGGGLRELDAAWFEQPNARGNAPDTARTD